MSDAPLLLADLEREMRRQMLAALPADDTGSLHENDFRAVHTIYASWRARVPTTVPCRVHLSAELLANPERGAYGLGLEAILRELALGADLRSRMSKDIDCAYALPLAPVLARRPPRRRHVDALLADWGIHHLHLSTQRDRARPEFVARTPHVLFVAFVRSDAYLIDLREHESDGANWSELAILETVVRNWPDAGIAQPSDTELGLVGGNWSDEDRRELRRAGVSGAVAEIDGRVWLAGGQTVHGAPSRVARHCMATSWFLSGYSPTEAELRGDLAAMSEKHSVPNDSWRAHVDGDDYGFVNEGVFVSFGSLLP